MNKGVWGIELLELGQSDQVRTMHIGTTWTHFRSKACAGLLLPCVLGARHSLSDAAGTSRNLQPPRPLRTLRQHMMSFGLRLGKLRLSAVFDEPPGGSLFPGTRVNFRERLSHAPTGSTRRTSRGLIPSYRKGVDPRPQLMKVLRWMTKLSGEIDMSARRQVLGRSCSSFRRAWLETKHLHRVRRSSVQTSELRFATA